MNFLSNQGNIIFLKPESSMAPNGKFDAIQI